MENYGTVETLLKGLKLKEFSLDFNIAVDKIICNENGICLNPNKSKITEVYRFEGVSNTANENIVYAIDSADGGIKLSLTSVYGEYADTISTEMKKK